VPSVGSHLLEAICPIIAAAGVDANLGILQMYLDAVAIELDLVNPARSGRDPFDREAKAGSMKPGKGALTPIAAGFLR
jgi:hypothetical protein